MDVAAVHAAARQAVQHIRQREAPAFLEFQTYRFRAHSMFDPELYRDSAEVEQWKARGPIHGLSTRLKAQGRLSEQELLALDAKAQSEVDAAVSFAEAGTWEPVEDLLHDLRASAGPA